MRARPNTRALFADLMLGPMGSFGIVRSWQAVELFEEMTVRDNLHLIDVAVQLASGR